MGEFLKIIGISLALTLAIFFVWLIVYQEVEFRTVISGSMSPSINAGDVVAVQKANLPKLKVGDIITFRRSETYTTHRIANITTEGYITKGDANGDLDIEIVSRPEIVGEVIFAIPYLGYLGTFVRTPLGFAIFILIPGILIIISEARKIHKESKRGKHKVPRLEYRP